MATYAKPLARPKQHAEEEHEENPREDLMHDPLPRGQMNAMVMESMNETNPLFWLITAVLAGLFLFAFGYGSSLLILQGHCTLRVYRAFFSGDCLRRSPG